MTEAAEDRIARVEEILRAAGTHEPACSLIASEGTAICDCWLST